MLLFTQWVGYKLREQMYMNTEDQLKEWGKMEMYEVGEDKEEWVWTLDLLVL
jgi:hypothetical protein